MCCGGGGGGYFNDLSSLELNMSAILHSLVHSSTGTSKLVKLENHSHFLKFSVLENCWNRPFSNLLMLVQVNFWNLRINFSSTVSSCLKVWHVCYFHFHTGIKDQKVSLPVPTPSSPENYSVSFILWKLTKIQIFGFTKKHFKWFKPECFISIWSCVLIAAVCFSL